MKKGFIIFKVLSLGLITSTIAIGSLVDASATTKLINENESSINVNDEAQDNWSIDTETRDITDNYVRSNVSEKKVEIINSEELRLKISDEDYLALSNNIDTVNEMLTNGTITMLSDGTMWFTRELRLRGGKINRTEVKYWGFRRYNNYANTKKAADELIKRGGQLKSVTNINPFILGLIGLTGGAAAAIAGVVGLGNTAGSWAHGLGVALRDKNNTYGTILDINWMGQYKVFRQKSTTK